MNYRNLLLLFAAGCGSEAIDRLPADSGAGVSGPLDSGQPFRGDSGGEAMPDSGVAPDGGPSGGLADPGAVAAQIAAAECAYLERCASFDYQYLGFQNQAECIASRLPADQLALRLFAGAVSAGRVSFSQSQLTACLNEYSTASCSAFGWDPSSACSSFLQGQQGLDAPCFGPSGECAPGLECTGEALCGRCAPRAGPGEDCEARACREDLSCENNAAGARVCLPRAPLGGPCGSDETGACSTGASCAAGTCQPQTSMEGAPCSFADASLPDCDFSMGLTCDQLDKNAPGVCVRYRFSGLGEACDFAAYQECTVGLDCAGGKSGPGVCEARASAGEPCASPFACVPGAYCDLAAAVSICIPRRDAGAACDENNQCAETLLCTGGVCAELTYRVCT